MTSDYGARRYLKGLAEIGLASLVLLGTANASRCQEIHIQILDGQTGRPVTNQWVEMWVGTYQQSLVAPAENKEGTATFIVAGGGIKSVWPPDTRRHRDSSPRELPIPLGLERVAASPFVAVDPCWDLGSPPLNPWYQISELLQHGAVSQNRCGDAEARAKPGELILFVKT